MKIEMLESLGCSYLRHVRKCWIVQANWKASGAWPRRKSAAQLETLFQEMKARFDDHVSEVFKGTKNAEQFLRQAEIDILGVDFNGNVHALEVAFHEAGLNYVGKGGTRGRVLKKLLRTGLVLQAFDSFGRHAHVGFVSPKVNPATASALHEVFDLLRHEYPDIDWHLYINDSFASKVLDPTLAATEAASDTSELFVRAARLIGTGAAARNGPNPGPVPQPNDLRHPGPEQLQPHVRTVMRTLLEERPDLLGDGQRRRLLDADYCKHRIGLKISGLPLLRQKHEGRNVSGEARYWADVYAGSYYVCSQWWQDHHLHNAQRLVAYLKALRENACDGQAGDVLDGLSATISDYVRRNSAAAT